MVEHGQGRRSPSRAVISLPVVGAGSQQQEPPLEFMAMPRGMNTYQPPRLPEPAARGGIERVCDVLRQIRENLAAAVDGRPCAPICVAELTESERELLGQALGEGEVSAKVQTRDGLCVEAQEAVFTGVWRVLRRAPDGELEDRIEVGACPTDVVQRASADGAVRGASPPVAAIPEGVMNGPSIAAELLDVWRAGRAAMPHVVNLTLLPFTPADVQYLNAVLGEGSVTILSRGYGNCRITNTERPATWHLTYFNSQDDIILRTVEVCDVPEVACAAGADLVDSELRLRDVLSFIEAS